MKLRDQAGVTLIELLVAMAISVVVMTSVFYILTVFLNDSQYDTERDQAQSDSQLTVDRLSRELRNAVSNTSGSTGLLEDAGSYDIVFQSVNPTSSTTGYNHYRVRYCLDSSETLWRQTETWTGSTPSVPDITNCPSTSNLWAQKTNGSPCCKVLTDVANESGSPNPVFTYSPTPASTSPGYYSTSGIKEVEVNVITDVHPGHLPGPSPQLTSAIYLRNELSPPTAAFTISQTPNSGDTYSDVVLNGSTSSDPNGQTLSYQWYANSGSTGCSGSSGPSTGLITSGTSEIYNAGSGFQTGTTETFALVVTDTGGAASCQSSTVRIS